eukprot:gene21714-1240_t
MEMPSLHDQRTTGVQLATDRQLMVSHSNAAPLWPATVDVNEPLKASHYHSLDVMIGYPLNRGRALQLLGCTQVQCHSTHNVERIHVQQ